MTQYQPGPDDQAAHRAAQLIAQAISELQNAASNGPNPVREELAATRAGLQSLAERIERQLSDEKEQRLLLASQLTSLATSLDRLVSHLHGLSQLMADVLERLAEPAPAAVSKPEPAEPAFQPGGEGVSLTLASVPGFQALMDVQKGLGALEQVESASVERYQDGDAKLLLNLGAAIRAADLAAALRLATGLTIVVEESRPELLRLRLKVLPAGNA